MAEQGSATRGPQGSSPDEGLLHLVETGPRVGRHHEVEALHAGRQRAQVDAQRVLPRVPFNQVPAVGHAPCSGRRGGGQQGAPSACCWACAFPTSPRPAHPQSDSQYVYTLVIC